MKLQVIRSRRRTLSIVLLITFVQSLIAPNVSFALTAGAIQPEYTSYEEAGASDMVNLLTGDLNLNMPVLEVPSPEGGFTVPLFYHAGIQPEQEASWTGLGWNINVGAIVRSYNQYPDDASGEANTVSVVNLTGEHGYNIEWLTPYREQWNSVTGKYGDLNLLDILEFEWGSKKSVGILGFHVSDGHTSFNPEQFVNAIMSIAGMEIAAAESKAATSFADFAKDFAMETLGDRVTPLVSVAASAASGSETTEGYWKPSYSNHFSLAVTANPLKGIFGLKNSWRVWLDQSRQENMFGSLYAGKAPLELMKSYGSATLQNGQAVFVGCKWQMNGTSTPIVNSFLQSTDDTNYGAASDVNFSMDEGEEYQDQVSPVLPANDQYSVNAPGISGVITPYRLDIGSVSMPREMTERHIRLAPVSYLDYKVPFIYEGSPTNQYLHHVGAVTGSPVDPGFNYGITKVSQQSYVVGSLTYPLVEFDLRDQIFQNERIRADIVAAGPDRNFDQANHIEWFTNDEIKNGTHFTNGTTFDGKFMDFLAGTARATFRTAGPNTIGGYTITAADGKRYHFALPVYSKNEENYSVKVTDELQTSSISRTAPFATTWLLTAITGPDFIDRNSNGMVDDGDFGYWMKFNYGEQADNYAYRSPYAVTGPPTYTVDAENNYKSYSKGEKELYYLNSIESRSHVALFMKSERADGYSAMDANRTVLGLDEIALLQKDSFNKLVNVYGMANFSSGIYSICMTSGITPAMSDYIKKNAIKKVLFTYDYSLCQQTTNAIGPFNPQKGKLTLTKVSVRGRNDVKMFPDYLFEYASNPNYGENKWDGWGMYAPDGTESNTSHHANEDPGNNGNEWSLSKVTTPTGSEILFNYERDSYSKVSDVELLGPEIVYAQTTPENLITHTSDFKTIPIDNSNNKLVPNDRVQIVGHVEYTCGGVPEPPRDFTQDFTVVSVTSSSVTLNADYRGIETCNPNSGVQIAVSADYGKIYKYIDRKGGNIRIGSLVVNDMDATYKTRYLYTALDGSSSGAVAQEPAYIRETDYPFYKYVNYPTTPVVYSRVSILRGKLSTDADYTSKQVFEMEPPSAGMYSQTMVDQGTWEGVTDNYLGEISDFTSEVGRLNRVTMYDKNNTIVSQSTLEYNDGYTSIPNNTANTHQGVFSQGTLLFDMFNNPEGIPLDLGGTGYDYTYVPIHSRVNRTTLLKFPSVLKKITNTKDGFTTTSENTKWDFISGQVLESVSKSALGVNVKTERVPAYSKTQFAGMGPLTNHPERKNMLNQLAATYVHRVDDAGNKLGLIEGNATTWKSNWQNYTNFNSTTQQFQETADGNEVIFRVAGKNVFKGTFGQLNPSDGTLSFSSANEFDFGSSTNTGWVTTQSISKYDHFSMPVEMSNITGILSTVKMGYDNSFPIAKASNAKYSEIAFSSAEDLQSNNFFGGEVFKGTTATVVRGSTAHTGDAVLSVPVNAYGFVFKSTGILPNKIYRASVWTKSTDGRLYYNLNGVETLSLQPTLHANGWYQINLEIPIPINTVVTSFEVGVKANGGSLPILFDDFRFQPADATMTCYVVNPVDYDFSIAAPTYSPEFSWTLDNDNLFQKREYNEAGDLVKIYKESFKYDGAKLVSEFKKNYRRGLN